MGDGETSGGIGLSLGMMDFGVKKICLGSSLAVQWLGLGGFTAVALVQSLVGVLGSCEPRSVAQTNEQTNKQKPLDALSVTFLLWDALPLAVWIET